ncbi:MAG TPA: VOC family protein [Acidimicrobiales bacterium]|jgi:catechol 2,3-dioxygenase-like lactoylglutathione lyase family enzyme|nr:VOC family protein [Acidimicrobiales bacterium]
MSSFPAFNHYALTVSNLQRSIERYERLFESPPVSVIDEDNYRAAIWFEPMFAIHENQPQLEGNVFDEFQIGLDHIVFGFASREELEPRPTRLDALGIEHGEILDRSYGAGLAFRDADNIQLEFFLRMGS